MDPGLTRDAPNKTKAIDVRRSGCSLLTPPTSVNPFLPDILWKRAFLRSGSRLSRVLKRKRPPEGGLSIVAGSASGGCRQHPPGHAYEHRHVEDQRHAAIAEDRAFQVQLIRAGLEPWPRTGAELGRIVQADHQRWKAIIEQANIQG